MERICINGLEKLSIIKKYFRQIFGKKENKKPLKY